MYVCRPEYCLIQHTIVHRWTRISPSWRHSDAHHITCVQVSMIGISLPQSDPPTARARGRHHAQPKPVLLVFLQVRNSAGGGMLVLYQQPRRAPRSQSGPEQPRNARMLTGTLIRPTSEGLCTRACTANDHRVNSSESVESVESVE